MSNYYTPDISEFHVGFEFEECVDGKTWYKERSYITNEFIRNNEFELQEWISENRIRVKYLDKQDIEELGFVQCKFVDGNTSETYISASFKSLIDGAEIHLGYGPDTLQLHIRKYTPEFSTYLNRTDHKCKSLFNGTIKNKSELKTLLKQLNIND